MYEIKIQHIFGENVIQNNQALIIKKSDFPLLSPLVNNTAESLLITILINAIRNFQGIIEDENNQGINDESNNLIEFDNTDAYTFLKMKRWNDFFTDRNNQRFIRRTIVIDTYEAE
ncbi:hypothetical protein [Nostoc sp. TCL26-01]|uniref:hypothetical protein n=1 Tax=Nostoc sp. TCL26-01 TaxID=2576904 RepID=UPI0015BC3255|nr:hypothetical protein [Nostoc sp. TCL26-01]QLE54833.1 hypothetical protein FD725_04470 [Nostoc sp. TCL26-01]QLE58761.1 hypothetical protein FD725_26615 [Nostoc sp. TCL26-01]